MKHIVLRLKSGREFNFECESYKYTIDKWDGSLINFSFEGAIGEVPVYFNVDDIEAIAILKTENKKQITNRKLKPCPFCGGNKIEIRTDDDGISWYIFCNDCGVMCGYAVSEDEVVEVWNKRAEREEEQ